MWFDEKKKSLPHFPYEENLVCSAKIPNTIHGRVEKLFPEMSVNRELARNNLENTDSVFQF